MKKMAPQNIHSNPMLSSNVDGKEDEENGATKYPFKSHVELQCGLPRKLAKVLDWSTNCTVGFNLER